MSETGLTTLDKREITGRRLLTQHSALKGSVINYPDKVAIVDIPHGYRKETYKELWERTNRLANALTDLGVKKGDKVCYWTEDRVEHIEIWFGAAKIGAVWTGVNGAFTPKEAEYVINHSDAVVLLISPAFIDKVKNIRANLEHVKNYIVFGEEEKGGMFLSYEALLAKASDKEPEVDVRDNDWDSLTYTSGTTGLPSGSLRTHASGLGWEDAVIQMAGMNRDAKVYAFYPNYHWGGNVTTRPVLRVGGTRWIPPGPDPKTFLETIQKEKINTVGTVASIGAMACAFPDIGKYDLSSVKTWMSSGSAWLMPMRQDVAKHFPNASLREFYSSTECFFAWATHEEVLTYERTSGFPPEGNLTTIRDESGKELPPGEWGLLCAKGPSVHDGYYKNAEKTESSLVGDGWFTAQDVGFKDEDGRVYVADRAKDIINTGGELVYPAEIENVILTHPKVAICAVLGTPDPIYTERVTAVVVLKPGEKGSSVLGEEIKEFCRGKMASFKLPRKVDFVKEIPYVGSGKVNKKKMRAEYWKDEKFKV